MIEAELPDGTILEFPDGTADEVIDRVVRAQLGIAAPSAAPPQGERGFWRAVGDNVIGFDDGVTSPGEQVGTWLGMGVESATLGLVGDEANAAAESLFRRLGDGRPAPSYDEALARRRGDEAAFRSGHPWLAMGAEVGGAVAPGLGWAGAARAGANLLGRTIAGGATGLAGGATQGLMEGENGAAGRVANALPSGLNPLRWGPAATGAVLGAALPGVGQALAAGYRAVAPGAAATLRSSERALGLRGAATQLASDAMAADAPYAADALRRAGPNAVNAQMGRETASLLDYVANQPGPARAMTHARVDRLAEDRAAAFGQAMDDTLGAPQGAARTQKGIMESTAANRRDAYGAAYAAPIDYASEAGQRLEGILDRLDPSDLQRAERLARREGAASRQRLYTVADDGTVTWQRMPDVRELDYLTRALNDVGLATGAAGEEARIARDLAREIRGAIDDAVPEYRAAREAGRDPILNREAVEFGVTLLDPKVTMETAEDTLSGMGAAERRFAAQGLRSRIDEVMANARAIQSDGNMDIREVLAPLKALSSRASRTKLTALLGEQEADRLIAAAEEAYSAVSLRGDITVRSPTQPRQARDEVVRANNPPGPLEALQTGGTGAALGTAINRVAGNPALARLARDESMRTSLAEMLLAPAGRTAPALQGLPGLLQAVTRRGGQVSDTALRAGGALGAYLSWRQANPPRQPLRLTVTPGG